MESSVPVSITPWEIEHSSAADEELSSVRYCVLSGDWSKCVNPFYLDLYVFCKILLRGHRIVVRKVLRDRVLHLALGAHQGIF